MGMLRARRRPLLRAAAVGGIGAAAYQAGKRRQGTADAEDYQDDQIDQQSADQEAPAEPAAAPSDRIGALERLASLRDQGVLSPEEFQAEKQRILQGS